jgi:hypothetical protein
MAFDTDYPNRKDWRKQYHKSKAFDQNCRNHGSCNFCYSNRMYRYTINNIIIDDKLKDFYQNNE